MLYVVKLTIGSCFHASLRYSAPPRELARGGFAKTQPQSLALSRTHVPLTCVRGLGFRVEFSRGLGLRVESVRELGSRVETLRGLCFRVESLRGLGLWVESLGLGLGQVLRFGVWSLGGGLGGGGG